MRLHIGEKIKQQKAMLISGKKYRPLMEDRVQRMAVYLMIGFFAFMFVCTIISRASHSFTTALVSVSSMTSKTLMNRAEMEGIIHAAAEKGISLPDGLKVVSVNAGKGRAVDKGEVLIEFDISSVEEQIKKLEEEIHILNLRIDLSGNNGGNDVIEAQRTLVDAQKAYERIAAKYARTEIRLKEDYTKLEETLADAEKNLIKKAEALVKEARENLDITREDAEDAIRAAEQALDEESENLDDSEDGYQQALETYEQAKEDLNMAKQKVSEIKEAIAGKQPDDDADYTEELKAAEEELSIAQKAYNQAQKELSKADYTSSSYDRADDNLDSIKRRWRHKTEKAKDALYEAETVLEAVREGKDFSTESAVSEAQAAIDAAREALNRARRESEDNQYSEEEELYAAGRAIETAQAVLEDARRQADVLQKEDEIDRLTKTVILANGGSARMLGIPGESLKGIRLNAPKDGLDYKGKNIYIIGGADGAVKEAIYLAGIAGRVTIVCVEDELVCIQEFKDKAAEHHNIEIMPHSSLTAVYGNERAEELEFTDNKTGNIQMVKDAGCGVFVYAGIVPNTQIYTELRLDNGYIPVDQCMQTEIPGVFAAGDICVKKVRQVATAVADGAIAGIQAAAMC